MRKTNTILKRLACLIVLACVFCVAVFVSKASETTSTTRIEMNDDEKRDYRIKLFLEVLHESAESYKKQFILSFDVSEDGRCVLLFDNATIVVIEPSGKVSKVLKFDKDVIDDTRSVHAWIKWKGDDLELILIYDVSYLFTTEGEILDVWRYEAEIGGISTISKITANEYTYEIKYSNMFVHFLGGQRYDMLTRTNSSGEVETLFDSAGFLPDLAVEVIAILIFFHVGGAYVGISIFVSYKKKRKNV